MTKGDEFHGGCLCGALRYAVNVLPIDTGYCHCRLCQRSSGAPVLAWASFPVEAFAYLKDTPRVYRSSPRGQREFCPTCGTQIAFRDAEAPTTIDVNVASLNHPESLPPQYHIWTESRIAWFDTADTLPRFKDAGPDRKSS